MPDSVLVLGGGVAGMTAAHELGERGFTVTVLEHRDIPGGKARSVPVPNSGTGGRPDLPGEHGFRFFPGFYKHVPDTMRRIPYESNPKGVLDNLETATRAELAQVGKPAIVLPSEFPKSVDDLRVFIDAMFRNDIGMPQLDKLHFAGVLLKLLTACDERRYGEYEYQSWWDFSEADRRSQQYQKFLADGLTRTLVAARARQMSARTGGYILLQLLLDMGEPTMQVDRVLNGPTNDVWIDPWRTHLQALHVDYQTGVEVTGLVLNGRRIVGVDVDHNGTIERRTADWVVAALPVEVMARLVTPQMTAVEPKLANLGQLITRWMNGVQFYLRRDLPIVHGHVIYIDSPWALTSISQAQFWPHIDLTTMGDGTVHGILSVDVSEWETLGLQHPEAMHCTKEQVIEEVTEQLKQHLNHNSTQLRNADIHSVFVDQDIVFPNPLAAANLEPLLVNTEGSWDVRPDAAIAIENLFLASDYVRTYTDLATMEGANEAARRAVNGILRATGSNEPKCEIWPLHEPAVFAPLRALDRFRYRRTHGSSGPVGPGPGT